MKHAKKRRPLIAVPSRRAAAAAVVLGLPVALAMGSGIAMADDDQGIVSPGAVGKTAPGAPATGFLSGIKIG